MISQYTLDLDLGLMAIWINGTLFISRITEVVGPPLPTDAQFLHEIGVQ